MAPLIPFITAVSGALGIVSSIKGLTAKKEAPKVQQLPKTPTLDDSAKKAEEETKKRRRMMQQTDITRGTALVPQLNVEQKSLLGF